MKTIESLRTEIKIVEEDLKAQWVDLSVETQALIDDINPIKKLKKAFTTAVESGSLKEGIMDSVLSFSSGFLSKKVIFGNTKNPVKKILGAGLQLVVSELVYKNSDVIKSALTGFFSKVKKNLNDDDTDVKSPTP